MTQSKVIGITGGSGCGKSYVSAELAKLGAAVIDCDKIAREVMEPGMPCLSEVAEFFGADVLENGCLNRKRLAEIVFSDKEKLAELNRISHKYILAGIYEKIEQETAEIIIIDGAVLIESGVGCDVMIGVLADREIREKRIMERDGLTVEEARRRISAQKPDKFYLENCDFVVYNNNEINTDELMERIKNENSN